MTHLREIGGQHNIIENLLDEVLAFRNTNELGAHSLMLGPSGMGKTTIAKAYADELGVPYVERMATDISDVDHIVAILLEMKKHTILFIDEIHALKRNIQESLYKILESGEVFYNGAWQKLKPFQMIGATTHAGELMPAFMRRFKPYQFIPYDNISLTNMIHQNCMTKFKIDLDWELAREIANVSCGTPGRAMNILNSVIRKSKAKDGLLNVDILHHTLRLDGLDMFVGFDVQIRAYLMALAGEQGKALGISAIAAKTKLEEDTIKYLIEPYLLQEVELPYCYIVVGTALQKVAQKQKGLMVEMTPRGRVLTPLAYMYLDLVKELQAESNWFIGERLGN